MLLALVPEWLGAGVEAPEEAEDVGFGHAVDLQPVRERLRVRRVLRAEAAIAAPGVRRADGTAASLGDRPEAWRPVSNSDADSAAPFALDAHAVRRDARATVLDDGCEDLQELAGVDRAAV